MTQFDKKILHFQRIPFQYEGQNKKPFWLLSTFGIVTARNSRMTVTPIFPWVTKFFSQFVHVLL